MKRISRLRNNPKAWMKDAFPISKWLPRLGDLPYDVIAGITVGLTILPISLAYAQMAYLRPEYGLYSSFLAQFIYIFIGTSKDAIIGPSAISSMLLTQFNALNPLSSEGDNTYATLLAMSSGLILLLIGVLRLGFIVNLFSIPVVAGFTSASAFAISASQLKTLFGLEKAPYDSPGVFVKQVANLFQRWHEIKPFDVAIGFSSLAFLLFVEYSHAGLLWLIRNKLKSQESRVRKKALSFLNMVVVSRSAIVFFVTTGLSFYVYSNYPSEVSHGITIVGYIKPGFIIPRAPSFQVENVTQNVTVVIQDSSEVLKTLSVAIFIIPLMTIMETFAILKALGRKNSYRIDPTQELVALGLGNFLQSFYCSFPVTVATTKTVLNDQCGARSSLSTLAGIIIFLVSIGYLTPLFYYVPKAALSAILISAAHHLFDYHAAFNIWREYRPDIFVFLTTFALCLFYDLAYGIVIALLLNVLTFLHPIVYPELSLTKEPLTVSNGEDESMVLVVELSHGMKYPSTDKFIDKMANILASDYVHYVLDCRFVTGFDFTGIQAWHMLLRLAYHHEKHIIFTNVSDPVRRQLKEVGLEKFHHAYNVEEAVAGFSSCMVPSSTSTSNPQLASVNRLQRTISVVSGIGHEALSSRPSGASVHKLSVPKINFSPATPENQSQTENVKEQEAILLKLLEPTAPNFYSRLPITVGTIVEESGDPSEGVENEYFLRHTNSTPIPLRYGRRNSSFASRPPSSIDEVNSNGGESRRRQSNPIVRNLSTQTHQKENQSIV